jgi:hypothetical protein
VRKASTLALTIAILISGNGIAAPFADPTKPYVEETLEINLQSDIFAKGKDSTTLVNARWQVSFIKTYPNNSNKNWALIEGRRVGVGSTILGGRVLSFNKKQMEIQQGHEIQTLILLECDSADADCNSMYYFVLPRVLP